MISAPSGASTATKSRSPKSALTTDTSAGPNTDSWAHLIQAVSEEVTFFHSLIKSESLPLLKLFQASRFSPETALTVTV